MATRLTPQCWCENLGKNTPSQLFTQHYDNFKSIPKLLGQKKKKQQKQTKTKPQNFTETELGCFKCLKISA